VKEQIDFWKLGAVEGLNAAGRAAQDKIMAIPARLERVAEALESRSKRKTFSFELAFNKEFVLE
jgi:acyl-[acyl-carrier-protein] desaturase